MPKNLIKSVTYGNGTENTQHYIVNRILATKSYFCRPYHSREKGTAEDTTGLMRRFFSKGTDFDKISGGQIPAAEDWLDGKPRKCLNFLTPIKVFNSAAASAS